MFTSITPRLFREPISAGTAALITAGAQLTGTGLSAISQGSMNRKTRKWNEKMYEKQRANSLADWNLQNEYNSPRAQIERMRAAGLNPALMYKNMPDNTATPVKTPDMQSWNPKAANYDNLGNIASNSLSTYMDMQMKKATLDNLTEQNTILKQDQLLKQAQTTQVIANTESIKQNTLGAQFDLKMKNALQTNQLQVAEQNLRAITKQTDVLLNRNEREALQNVQSLREGAQRILNMREQNANSKQQREFIKEQIHNLWKDRELKQLDIDLKKTGVQPSDELWQRILGRVLGSNTGEGVSPSDFFKLPPLRFY
jgi:hypothetical protein